MIFFPIPNYNYITSSLQTWISLLINFIISHQTDIKLQLSLSYP